VQAEIVIRRGRDVDVRDVTAIAVPRRGAEGEELVGEALLTRVAAVGGRIEHSLPLLRWGHIEHLTAGPGGITVIAAENWTADVIVRGGMPRAGGWSKAEDVDKVVRQIAAVRVALRRAGLDAERFSVEGALCLARDRKRPLERLGQHAIALGGTAAVAELAARAGPLSPAQIDGSMHALLRELPRVHTRDVDELLGVSVEVAGRDVAARDSGELPGGLQGAMLRVTSAPPVVAPARARRPLPGRSPRRAAIAAGLALALAVAGFLALHSSRPTSRAASWGPAFSLSDVSLRRSSGNAIVSFMAPARERVAVTITARHRRHRRLFVASGHLQRWTARHLGRPGGALRMSICIATPDGRCRGAALQSVTIERH
jgi:hypothetical protein